MTDKFIQINNNNQLEGFENLDLSNGYACDMETGICGPIDDIKLERKSKEEKKNANNNMV